jgi:hypothetical protein
MAFGLEALSAFGFATGVMKICAVKSWLRLIVSAGVAGIVIFVQWFAVEACDNFTGERVGNVSYKVFTYGFPFRIIDAAPGYPALTPPSQIPSRVGGNFVCFLLLVFAALSIWTATRRRSQSQNGTNL